VPARRGAVLETRASRPPHGSEFSMSLVCHLSVTADTMPSVVDD
jgi:hypothetical protein